MRDKIYIKRWKQKAFNTEQINDTKSWLDHPKYIDFPIDCIFSIDKHGDCTFYMEKESMERCRIFGRFFYWKSFLDDLDYISDPEWYSMPGILECYFVLQPEIVEGIPDEFLEWDYKTSDIFPQKDIKLLVKSKYINKPKEKYSFMEVLQLKRLLLRFKWEEQYYKRAYNFQKKAINYRIVKEVSVSIIKDFNGKEESNDKIHYIFNPHNVKKIKGTAIKLDEGLSAKSLFTIMLCIGKKILVVPNARPELVEYFTMEGLVGFISEEGGATAHSVVIARELNIPCAVGVSGIMDKVKTGDIIEIDMENKKINITK